MNIALWLKQVVKQYNEHVELVNQSCKQLSFVHLSKNIMALIT